MLCSAESKEKAERSNMVNKCMKLLWQALNRSVHRVDADRVDADRGTLYCDGGSPGPGGRRRKK